MTVPVGKRKESQFEVIIHFYRTRKRITDLLLRDFGYSEKKSQKHLEKMFGDVLYEELSDDQKNHYDIRKSRQESFETWFIEDRRNCVMDCLRNIQEYITVANSMYPEFMEELIERRLNQDKAIGQCQRLLQELQYTMEVLPVDINKYIPFADDIDREIALLKKWRKSDNKFKKKFEE